MRCLPLHACMSLGSKSGAGKFGTSSSSARLMAQEMTCVGVCSGKGCM